MKNILFTILILLPSHLFAQFLRFSEKEPTSDPDIHYYKFYDGIQMVELDYLSAYHRRVNYLEQAQPRALTWENVLGAPHPNVYLFRNENGEIVKCFGDLDSIKLLSVEASHNKMKYHNSFGAQLGSVIGFSQISTRYFPFYLIGNTTKFGNNSLGLIDSLGNVVLEPEYHVIWKHDNIFITRKQTFNEIRDCNLNLKYSTTEFLLQPAQNHTGCADILKNEKCGLMDANGKIIVPCEYDILIDGFNEMGLAQVSKKHLIGYVNTKGKEVIKCKYQSVGYFKEGLLDVRLKDKWGYIDIEDKTVIPFKYEIGIWFEEGLARVAKREAGIYYFGFIDKEGDEVIPLIYSNAKDFKDGIAEVMVDGKWIKIDKKGVKQ
jgi:hypothetical protein